VVFVRVQVCDRVSLGARFPMFRSRFPEFWIIFVMLLELEKPAAWYKKHNYSAPPSQRTRHVVITKSNHTSLSNAGHKIRAKRRFHPDFTASFPESLSRFLSCSPFWALRLSFYISFYFFLMRHVGVSPHPLLAFRPLLRILILFDLYLLSPRLF